MNAPIQLRGRVARARDHAVGAALAAAYVVVLMRTAGAIGLSRDEGIYVDAAQRYGRWLEQLWSNPGLALQRASIDAAFAANHEHPPLMKLSFALSYLAHQKLGLFATDSLAFRFPTMLSAGLLLWVIYIFGTRLYGRSAGLFAALCYALMPRPFYHAHLNAFDVPITFGSTLVTYAYYRSLRNPRLSWLLGATFGMALLIKHNSWLLPGVFGIHFALCALVETRVRRRTGRKRLVRAPYWLLAMALLGPALFIAGWPWMWHDTLHRVRAYAAFHLHHEYYNIEYFGVNYFWPPFPVAYPWVMTLFTLPLTTTLLGLGGCVDALRVQLRELRSAWSAQRRPLSAPDGTRAWPHYDPTLPALLLLGCMLAPIVVIALPSTPIFGGTKHWFPAYPPLALFAGRALQALLERWPLGRFQRPLAFVAGGLLLLPAAVETAHSHPFALSHYTVPAGGVPGAAHKGMNRQFWGFTTRSLVPYFKHVLPHGGTLYVCDTIYWSFEMLIRDGLLPSSFRQTRDIATADYALVHHEKHFIEVDTEIWTTYGSVQPAYLLTYDGVPIISVYENPLRRAQHVHD